MFFKWAYVEFYQNGTEQANIVPNIQILITMLSVKE